MKQRLEYIDQLKGFAIFLVVTGHVLEYCLTSTNSGYESVWHKLIYSFHMPLFAFLSGLFMKGIVCVEELRRKSERLLLPLFTIGIFYVLWRGFSIESYAFDSFKYGYWYLLVMFLSLMLITCLKFLNHLINKQNSKFMELLLSVVMISVVSISSACSETGGGITESQ